MKYFHALLLYTPMGVVEEGHGGKDDVRTGIEASLLPFMSERRRTVGFDGQKEENLNKAPLLLRPRVRLRIPGGFHASLSYVPPLRVFDVTPHLGAAAVGYTPALDFPVRLGARLFGHVGSIKGAFTCSEQSAAESRNPYGCDRKSHDRLGVTYAGADISAAMTPWPEVSPYLSVATAYLMPRFEVDAVLDGFRDTTVLSTRGFIVGLSLGASSTVARRFNAALEGFYAPLWISRPGESRRNDGVRSIRVVLAYRFVLPRG